MKEQAKEQAIIFTVIVLAIIIGLTGYSLTKTVIPLKGVGTDPSFSAATNYTKTCTGGASTSTLVQATSTGRTAFSFSSNSSGTITLCRDIVCTAGSGVTVTSTAPRYEQQDSYIGPYSCVANVSSTVGGWTSP